MIAGRARVKRELVAETNGSYITSELSYFWVRFLPRDGLGSWVLGPLEHLFRFCSPLFRSAPKNIRATPRESAAKKLFLTEHLRPNAQHPCLTFQHSPARPRQRSSECAALTVAAPETPRAVRSDTSTRPRSNCPSGDSRVRAQSLPAATW